MDRETHIKAALAGLDAALAAERWRKAPDSSERWAAGERMIEALDAARTKAELNS